jgi:hypothetical protein
MASDENGGPTVEVQAAYERLVATFAAFGEAMGEAASVGIDTQAVVVSLLQQSMGGGDLDGLPAPARMLLGL